MNLYRNAIRIQETDSHLFQVLWAWKRNFIREDRVAVVEHDSIRSALDKNFRQALDIIRGGLLFYCVKIVDGEEEVGVSCCVDEGFGQEFVRGIHHVERLLITEMITETKIVCSVF